MSEVCSIDSTQLLNTLFQQYKHFKQAPNTTPTHWASSSAARVRGAGISRFYF